MSLDALYPGSCLFILSYHPSHAIQQNNNTIIFGITFLIARNRLPNASHDSQQQEMSILVVCHGGITPNRKGKKASKEGICVVGHKGGSFKA